MNENRRKFLKIMFIGSGALLAEKVLSPLFSFLDAPSAKADSANKNNFKDFRVVEGQKGLSVYDNSGEEILQIDKGA